jgi:hypothetical protein
VWEKIEDKWRLEFQCSTNHGWGSQAGEDIDPDLFLRIADKFVACNYCMSVLREHCDVLRTANCV